LGKIVENYFVLLVGAAFVDEEEQQREKVLL
jgi:hypothetical protein